MVELEYHADKVDQHDIWEAVRRKDVTPTEVDEFRDEMEEMVRNLKDELTSLESKVEDAIQEAEDAVPKCIVCDEPIDPEECEDGVCEDCGDDEDG